MSTKGFRVRMRFQNQEMHTAPEHPVVYFDPQCVRMLATVGQMRHIRKVIPAKLRLIEILKFGGFS